MYMKKILISVITFSTILSTALPAFAVSVTPTPVKSGPTKADPSPTQTKTKETPTPGTTSEDKQQTLINQINNLKEKVASKVAELKLVEKRGIIGVVTQASDNKITLTDGFGETRFVDVDELTKFSSVNVKGSFGISDISAGMPISVIGLYNKDSRRLLARFVNEYIVPVFISGQITDVDKINYTITVVNEQQKKMIVDIENITRTSTYNDEDGVTKAGFSKIETGQRVHVIGYLNKNDKKRLTATRILIFPDLPKNPKIALPDTAITPTIEISETPKPTTSK